ncbi:MAG: hypothetical protein R6V03_04375 [Kiritimatiellia bacterium]
MLAIRICSIGTIESYRAFAPNYLVSILDPGLNADAIRPSWLNGADHYKFCFADLIEPSRPSAPRKRDIEEIVEMGQTIAGPESEASILVHCAAGISRSPAAAYILFCIHAGPGKEAEALKRTVSSSEEGWIYPNSLMVGYADEILGRGGRMVRELERRYEMDGISVGDEKILE